MADPLQLLASMLRIRAFEAALAARPDHGFQLLSSGEEAVAVGLAAALTENDQLLTGGRSIAPALALGLHPGAVMAELLGRVAGMNGGKAGRGHMSAPDAGFFGAHAVVGGNISIAAGVALARQMSGAAGIVAILFGDGACGAGSLHETLNIAALWKLPLLFVCNNNGFSVSTPRSAAIAAVRLSDLAIAHGIPARTVNGLDVEAVAEAAGLAAAGVRAGAGPAFLEFTSVRLTRHSTRARESRSRAELARLWALCPIKAQAERLMVSGALDPDGLARMEREATAAAAEAIAFAEASPCPGPEEALKDVW